MFPLFISWDYVGSVYFVLYINFCPLPSLSLFDEIMLHLSPYDVCALVFLQMENLCIRN